MVGFVGWFYNKKYTKPMYESYSSIILSATDRVADDNQQSITTSDIAVNEKLVNTYAEVIKSETVLNTVINNLKLNISNKKLYNSISITTDPKTTVIKICVKLENPNQAIAVSEELINVFFGKIRELYNVKTASVLDHPVSDGNPVNINPKKYLIIGAIVGLVVSVTISVMMEILNDKVKTDKNVEEKLKLTILANIPKYKGDGGLISLNQDNVKNESFRALVANIKYFKKKSLLITSNMPDVGKSFVSANLALTYASSGKKTLLIDSDLRKGVQHHLFQIQNKRGLSDLIRDNSCDYKKYINESVVENLDIITKGLYKISYSKLLFSNVIGKIIEQAKEEYDFIVVDGTPNEIVADDTLLYAKVDSTIIVAKYDSTKYSAVSKLKRNIKIHGGNILGVVINNIPYGYMGEKKYYYYEEKKSLVSKNKYTSSRH